MRTHTLSKTGTRVHTVLEGSKPPQRPIATTVACWAARTAGNVRQSAAGTGACEKRSMRAPAAAWNVGTPLRRSAPAVPANTPEGRPRPPATATAGGRANPTAAAVDAKTFIASAPRAPVPNTRKRMLNSSMQRRAMRRWPRSSAVRIGVPPCGHQRKRNLDRFGPFQQSCRTVWQQQRQPSQQADHEHNDAPGHHRPAVLETKHRARRRQEESLHEKSRLKGSTS